MDRGVEDRVVRGVEHAVAETRRGHHDDEHRVRRRDAGQRDGARQQREAHEQDASSPEPIHQEAGHGLADRRGGGGRRDQRAERGIRYDELGAQQREQRRQHEPVEVTEEVADADDRDESNIGGGGPRSALGVEGGWRRAHPVENTRIDGYTMAAQHPILRRRS
jgi:hypothetical protein